MGGGTWRGLMMCACPVAFVCVDYLIEDFPLRGVATFKFALVSSVGGVVNGHLSHALRIAFQPGVCLYVYVFLYRCCDAVDEFVPFSARDVGGCSRGAGVIRRPRSRFV